MKPAASSATALDPSHGEISLVGKSSPASLARSWGPLVAISLAVLVWPIYLIEGSQFAYVASVVAASTAMAILVRQRSPGAIVLMVAEMALVGTEANGELASGSPVLGSVRLLDASLATAVTLLAFGWFQSHWRAPGEALKLSIAGVQVRLLVLSALLVGWATALWAMNGAPVDSLLRTDVRLVGLAIAALLLVGACRPLRVDRLLESLTWLSGAVALKAVALWASNVWAIGTDDRLQATANGASDRVILVGGDTLLILAPAVGILAFRAVGGRARKTIVGFTVALSGLAVVLSQGRTSIVLAAALGILAWLSQRRRPSPNLRRTASSSKVWRTAAAVALLGSLGLAAVSTGAAARFTAGDLPNTGVFFRIDEAREILRLPKGDLLLGQGLAGRFKAKDVNGQPVVAGWSHFYPLWVVLKVGVVGLPLVALLLVQTLRRQWDAARLPEPVRARWGTFGLVITAGILLMSVSLGRAALPEGIVLLSLGVGTLDPDDSASPR